MSRIFLALSLASAMGCAATIPADRYGVDSIRVEGAEEMGEDAILACLSTEARGHVSIPFGLEEAGSCGNPSFDADPPRLSLWRWWWTEWKLLDRIALEQDLERIERWYQARGFHAAAVTSLGVEPEQASVADVLPADEPNPGCERDDDDEGCRVDITIVVEEGEPTLVSEIRLSGHEELPAEYQEEIRDAVTLRVGERWDEHTYDQTKQTIRDVLIERSHAFARVEGTARIDRPAREARVQIEIEAGPEYVFGETTVVGATGLPTEPIRAAAGIRPGEPYSLSDLDDAQRAVYGLGAFSAVTIEGVPPETGNAVPLRIEVTPARRSRFGFGVGIQSGIITKSGFASEQLSVPQWDIHLIGRWTHRNFLGGLRQLTIEDRPRLIVQDNFPGLTTPRFGNLLSIDLRQPGFPEARTTTRINGGYDYGPDPFDTFFRHRLDAGVDVSRSFLHLQTFFALLGIRGSLYLVPDGSLKENGEPAPTSSELVFLEQQLRLDLRDDRQQPHAGIFLQISLHEAGYFLPSSWDYLRVLPDARAYIPLPAGMTLAARFALGMYFITRFSDDLDPLSQELGPRDFRLRGGGAASNRGFLPGRLGDGPEGGTRRWEASLELRIPVSTAFGFVVFGDAGDVSRAEEFRFNYPQLSVGAGFRLYTPVGALRFDIGGRIPGAQLFDTRDRRVPQSTHTEVSFGLFSFPGAVHLTIGESF